jgi:outer membrane protein OmpA-like peptidoglycan-associated protein/opacity protein-like surface antigen
MTRSSVGAFVLLACSVASADVTSSESTVEASVSSAERSHLERSSRWEAGIFSGGFISNYFHQFYDIRIPNRQELERVNPLLGVRLAHFPRRWFGLEVEGSLTLATTKMTQDRANIFGVRGQAVFQHRCPCPTLDLPSWFVPFVGIGAGVARVSSPMDVLGSDTDVLLHVGGGFRMFVTPSIALRAEGRFQRGPSKQAPYHLNASYGEFLFGVSFAPSSGSSRRGSSTALETLDSDGDGIPDAQDRCPNEPEDMDLFEDTDGCPDLDNDGDGIPDDQDQCPMEPEDFDGFADDDGCPDKDNDGDGIPDSMDACPNEPEDRDGFRDGDGCPDLDNDEDGIPDAEDRCPLEPETINGVDDNDGCPDKGEAAVVLSTDRLELFSPITFNGAKLTSESWNVLGQVGAMMRRHRHILRLRVTVHVQPTNNPDKDQALSDQRAAVVRDWLIEWGIDKKRIEARGFGSTKPLVDPRQRNSALINDRVELIILERE